MDIFKELANRFSPYIYFHKNETCFPIKLPTYLSQMELRNRHSGYVSLPTSDNLYDFHEKSYSESRELYLNPNNNNWKNNTKGDVNDSFCYVKIIPKAKNTFMFVYIYFFSHTEPYKLFNLFFELDFYAHIADYKTVGVEVIYDPVKNISNMDNICIIDVCSNELKENDEKDEKENYIKIDIDSKHVSSITSELNNYYINKVYYEAHGTRAGMWKNANEIQFLDSHPIAYSVIGDHSFYDSEGIYPRIFGLIYDVCRKDILCKPNPIQIFDNTNILFDRTTMGVFYFPGDMGPNGIIGASYHNFWNANYPEESSNWLKRLFDPDYF